jgi:cell division protein FtsN
MLYGFNTNQDEDIQEFHQRVADRNIQSIDERQEEIQRAKNSFLGILSGIVIGALVGWMFFGPSEAEDKQKAIPVIRRPITPAKVQPNDPGGMEIDNQDREIYNIIDNLPKKSTEVNIQPLPETPKIIVEKNIQTPDNIENLVENIENDTTLSESHFDIHDDTAVKLADVELSGIKTNSKEKIVIPEKIKDIDVNLQQKVINTNKATDTVIKKEETSKAIQAKPQKGTWYAQIIASSKRKTVENLWSELSKKHTFLNKFPHEVEEITSATGNTLYRLKVGAFKTRKEADSLATQLKQKQISCIIKQN